MMRTSESFRREVVELGVPAGKLAFWWLGQQSWVVRTGGTILGLDVYLKEDPRRIVPPILRPGDCDFFDALFVTHGHTDHFDQPTLGEIARVGTKTKFVIPKHLRAKANEIGLSEDRLVLMTGENEAELGPATVQSIPSAHEFLEYDAENGFEALGYIIRVNGFVLYTAGDTCYYDGMLARLKSCPLDLMFVPINGRDAVRYRRNTIGNLTYQEAVDLVGMVQPKLGVPAHWGMFSHNTEDPRLFAEYLEVKYPTQRYIIPRPYAVNWL